MDTVFFIVRKTNFLVDLLKRWIRREYCWFSHDVTNIQTTKLFILLIFYLHDV